MALERTVNELQTEKTWWTWWYGNWRRWSQTNVVRLSDVMCTISKALVGGRAIREHQQQEHRQQHQQYIARHAMEVAPGEGSLGTP